MDKILKAIKMYDERKARCKYPSGKFDSGKRWFPDETEMCDCCKKIRNPSRSYPYSLMSHCCSLKHICSLVGVDYKEVKQVIDFRV